MGRPKRVQNPQNTKWTARPPLAMRRRHCAALGLAALVLADLLAGCSLGETLRPYTGGRKHPCLRGAALAHALATPSPTPCPPPKPMPILVPSPSPEPAPTPLPMLSREEAWQIPDPYGYRDETGTPYDDYGFLRYLRGEYPLPDTREVPLCGEWRRMAETFFDARPELVRRIGAEDCGLTRGRVVMMDLTGDSEPEALIQYYPLRNSIEEAAGGVVEVYELSSGRYLGVLYTSDAPEERIGWYRDASGESSLYVLGSQWYRKTDPTGYAARLHHNAYILWKVRYDGQALRQTPLWFYDTANWPANFSRGGLDSHISIAAPRAEDMAAFSRDPYSEYLHIYELARQGADPVIRQSLRQLEPLPTEYAIFEYGFPPAPTPEPGSYVQRPPLRWGESPEMPWASLPWELQIPAYQASLRNEMHPLPDTVRQSLALPPASDAQREALNALADKCLWLLVQEADGRTGYYHIECLFFTLPQSELFHYAYILWAVRPQGGGYWLEPLWLYVVTPMEDITAKNGVVIEGFTLMQPAMEDALAFSADPGGCYEALRQRGAPGDAPAVYESLTRFWPAGS